MSRNITFNTVEDIANDLEVSVSELQNWFKTGCVSSPDIEWTEKSITVSTHIAVRDNPNKLFTRTFTFPFPSTDFDDWIGELEERAMNAHEYEVYDEDEEDDDEGAEDEEDWYIVDSSGRTYRKKKDEDIDAFYERMKKEQEEKGRKGKRKK